MISKVGLIAGMGDALNARSFLVTYCEQMQIPRSFIHIFTNRYWWMFEGMGFQRGLVRRDFRGLIGYKNFGNYNLPKTFFSDKNDLCIARNAGIDYSFDVITPLPIYAPVNIPLPKKFITFNTGYGDLSCNPKKPEYVCTKAWPAEYWERFCKLIGVPCVQIGAGLSCKNIQSATLNLVNKLTLQQSASVMREALFHVDIEGGLPILNQHLGKKSVVLFGPCAVENQGRSFNLNLRHTNCIPCYEWGTHKYALAVKKNELLCNAHCMTDLTPEYVVEQIYKAGWL